MKLPFISMRAALNDPDLFGSVFEGLSWAAWRILLIAFLGEVLTPEERVTFKALTGRDIEPGHPCDEFWAIIGRRGGKTRAVAVLAAFLASCVDYRHMLAPGERASLPILSATVWQSKKAKSYLSGIFANVPALKKLVINETADTISLSTRVDIECRPASFRSIRGGTAIAAIADEVAFWRSDDSANPDVEILTALRPCLATTGGPLIAISTPYSQRGELYAAWKRDYGSDGDPAILIAQAATRTMNPSLAQKVIDRAFERDPITALSEYGNENVAFRSDVEAFISREIVESIIIPDRYELPHIFDKTYLAFCDPSGGSGDDMVLAVAHREGEIAVLDCLRIIRPPFNPDEVTKEFADTLRYYGLYKVTGDRYGGEWPSQRFSAHGITYVPSEKTKSEIYVQALPLLMGRRVELLDHPKLASQLIGLERRCSRGGRQSIDHFPNGHDDVSNAACGALALAAGWSDEFDLDTFLRAYGGKPSHFEERRMREEAERKARAEKTETERQSAIAEQPSSHDEQQSTHDEQPPSSGVRILQI